MCHLATRSPSVVPVSLHAVNNQRGISKRLCDIDPHRDMGALMTACHWRVISTGGFRGFFCLC